MKIKSIHLITESILSPLELPEDQPEILEALSKDDSWLMLTIQKSEVAARADKEPENLIIDKSLRKDIESLRKLSEIDADAFLIKTRKLMESVVQEMYATISGPNDALALYEKLKALEAKGVIPKTTATFFHTLRILVPHTNRCMILGNGRSPRQ